MKKKLLFLFAMTLFLTGNLFAQVIDANSYRFNIANSNVTGITPTTNLSVPARTMLHPL